MRILNLPHVFLCYVNDDCGVLVSHTSGGHVHETTHGHKATTSSGHGEKREEEHKGITLYVLQWL